jgi:Acetylaranotin biosynthesis cluster protein L
MIFSETKLLANPPGRTRLTREQIWEGLEQKALDAVPYVEVITACRVIDRLSDTVFDREAEIHGVRYVERVWLEAPSRVVFARLDGPVLGTITNDILEEDDGEMSVRFQFALTVRPGDSLPITEQQLAAEMVSSYQAAAESTLAAVRDRLSTIDATR